MTRPVSHGPRMIAHDAAALANVLRRTVDSEPGPRDVTVITRAIRRAIADERRNNTKVIVEQLTTALSLASKPPPLDQAARNKFHRLLRAAISCLVDETSRKKSA